MNPNLRGMVSAQRSGSVRQPRNSLDKNSEAAFFDIGSQTKSRTTSSRLTLRKKLKFAQWTMPPIIFRVCEVGISVLMFALAYLLGLNVAFLIVGLLSGPVFMRWILNLMIDRRFKAFDKDYPSFLLSLVSLLKTGMNTMTALEAAAKGLEEGSLVKQECELMIERLRYGVSEDKSIGAFGEDIYHPEIELFVQALLLSRRVGGVLSDTLERLAKQVRRRQFFRLAAVASVAMQRGSIWFIVGILVAMEIYLYFVYPDAVVGAIKDPVGWQIWQAAVLVIMSGIFWVRQVTKMRV